MYEILQPPADSRLRVSQTFEGTQVQWKLPHTSWFSRLFIGVFMTVWLTGWTIGGIAAMKALFSSDPDAPLFGRIFLVFWLCGWFVGECFAILMLLAVLLPSHPSRLCIDLFTLTWEPSVGGGDEPPVNSLKDSALRSVLRSRKRILRKQDITDIRLDYQHLSIDVGDERLEIGRSLSESERRWLADFLQDWKES